MSRIENLERYPLPTQSTSEVRDSLAAVLAEGIEHRPLIRIWHERFIVGVLNLVAGEPGAGKSTLCATIAADLSRTGLNGIVSNIEDDIAPVTIPRLLAAGAILERIHLIPPDDAPLFPAEFELLEKVIREADIHYVILDPIGAHFDPEGLVNNRKVLRQLAGIARRTNCMILLVHHTTKMGLVAGPNAGLIGTPRSVYVYGYDPKDEDRRALSCQKMNGAEEPPTMVLEHEIAEVGNVDDHPVEASRLKIVGQSSDRASRSRGRRNTERDAACAKWLTDFLAAGEDCARRSPEVEEEARKQKYSQGTVRRAQVHLGVEKVRRGGWGTNGCWYWRLPDDHPARQASSQVEEAV